MKVTEGFNDRMSTNESEIAGWLADAESEEGRKDQKADEKDED